MGKNKEEGRMKIRRILLIKFDLPSEIVSGVVEGMNFVHPQGLLIKAVESQGKAYEETKNENKNFFSFWVAHNKQQI
jgi:hypothetical protein